jgi:hypothetical protein
MIMRATGMAVTQIKRIIAHIIYHLFQGSGKNKQIQVTSSGDLIGGVSLSTLPTLPMG